MKHPGVVVISIIIILFQIQALQAQTTGFTYQGSLKDGVSAANGNYDFEFALFSALSGGSQLGSTLSLTGVAVTNGVFSATLNFGNQFPGASRFLEIRVRPTGGGTFTTLTPRQPVNSGPYSVQSINATQLGGVAANQYLLAGSAIINAATQFNIGTDRVFSIGGSQNTYVGVGAGAVSSPLSQNNSFFGNGAGQSNTISGGNAFFGTGAGQFNTTGGENAFFGSFAGRNNTTADSNSFFGTLAGSGNTTGGDNAFFGRSAGSGNTTGGNNSYFGVRAGLSNTTSINNSFFGFEAGTNNTGANNSFFGVISGDSNTTGADNSFFGRSAGGNNTTGTQNSFFGRNTGLGNVTGNNNTAIGYGANISADGLSFATAIGSGATVSTSNTISIGRNRTDEIHLNGTLVMSSTDSSFRDIENVRSIASESILTGDATIGIATINVAFIGLVSGGGANGVCFTGDSGPRHLAFCGSSIRYKTNVNTFGPGLDLIRRLRPVSFNWKSNNRADFGLVAEEVAEAEPLLVTHNDKGEIEGVKYDRVGVVLVNAVKEQQGQIDAQEKRIEEQKTKVLLLQEKLDRQQSEIDALRDLVCHSNPRAAVCKEKK